jgi:ketosteroid isomerase-like protein
VTAPAGDQMPGARNGEQRVEVIRSIYEAFNVRDIDTVVELTHPDIVIRPLRTQSAATITGRDAFRAWLENGVAAGRTHRYEVATVHELADGAVILAGKMVEHETSFEIVGVHHLKDGLSWRVAMYFSDEQTLRRLRLLAEDGWPADDV